MVVKNMYKARLCYVLIFRLKLFKGISVMYMATSILLNLSVIIVPVYCSNDLLVPIFLSLAIDRCCHWQVRAFQSALLVKRQTNRQTHAHT